MSTHGIREDLHSFWFVEKDLSINDLHAERRSLWLGLSVLELFDSTQETVSFKARTGAKILYLAVSANVAEQKCLEQRIVAKRNSLEHDWAQPFQLHPVSVRDADDKKPSR